MENFVSRDTYSAAAAAIFMLGDDDSFDFHDSIDLISAICSVSSGKCSVAASDGAVCILDTSDSQAIQDV
jgi:hypothetical protein